MAREERRAFLDTKNTVLVLQSLVRRNNAKKRVARLRAERENAQKLNRAATVIQVSSYSVVFLVKPPFNLDSCVCKALIINS